MKNIFNHTKRPYTKWEEYEEDYDWDAEEDEYTSDGEYEDAEYAQEEEDGTYYMDGEYVTEEENFPEDAGFFEEEELYEEKESRYEEEPYYEEESYYEEEPCYEQEPYYEEESYYEEEPCYEEEPYYEEAYAYTAEDVVYEDDLYADDIYADEEEVSEDIPGLRRQGARSVSGGNRKDGVRARKENVFAALFYKFMNMPVMDRVILSTGVVVLVLALVILGVFISGKTAGSGKNAFVSVGAALEDIELIGGKGLLAAADAEKAKLAAAEIVEEEEEQKEYNEAEYGKDVKVEMDLSSIVKDLKVKFVNRDTGKLIANVPFSIAVTNPSGKSETWSDDDMDGIIYKTELKPGKYKASMNELTDEKYKKYVIPTETQSVEVKKDIAYKKVDVKNEIKKESEVDASKEDTKKNETQVESALKDTVEWVESTSTGSVYTEVAKNTIPDPLTFVSNKSFVRLSQKNVTVSAAKQELKAGETTQVTAVLEGTDLSNGVWSSSNTGVAGVSGTGQSAVITAVGSGTATISFQAKGPVSGNDGAMEYVGSCTVTVSDAAGTVTVNPASLVLAAGAQGAAKASASGFTAGKQLTYTVSSNRTDIASASVDAEGNITVKGVAAGDAVITVTVNYSGGAEATAAVANLSVKVTGSKTITLDKTSATVYLSVPVTVNAAITNATTQNGVTAESSDANVAAVSVNGRAVTITGVNPGSAVITVKYAENGEEVKASCAVTVKAHPKDDKSNKLKDNKGQQLYVEENGSYREAVYADYYTAAKFFVKGGVKYTGWQTIDGKVYFFDAAGNKMTGEQVIQGAKYHFASDGSLVVGSGTMGIDVSKWNGNIDWNAVKNSGVSYVIIRCGYRGSSQGSLIEDPKYAANIKGATEAGLKVGVYFFTQAVNEAEAVEEASMVLDQVKNYKISYPIFLDVEGSGGRGDRIDKATRTAVCKAFCETIQSAGYTAGIYANKNWLENKMDAGALNAYKIWLAQYAAAPTYKGRYDLWQYKSTGRVSGIKGNVDLNLSYLGY